MATTINSIDSNKDGYRDNSLIPVPANEALAESRKLATDAIVELFSIDLTKLGGNVMHFVNGLADDGSFISFGGIEYMPIALETSGWEVSSDGPPARPTVKISRVNSALSNLVVQSDDFIGCPVVRIRTFKKFLDNGSSPNPNVHFPKDYYKIERKTNANQIYIEFELSNALDSADRKIPYRRILKNFCSHAYRMYDQINDVFKYDNATCPYTGAVYYNTFGSAVDDPKNDACGKTLKDCKLRFASNQTLKPKFDQLLKPTVFEAGDYWIDANKKLWLASEIIYSVSYRGSTATPGEGPPAKNEFGDWWGFQDYFANTSDRTLWRYENPDLQSQTQNYDWQPKIVKVGATLPGNIHSGEYWYNTTNDTFNYYILDFFQAGYDELPFQGFPGAGDADL